MKTDSQVEVFNDENSNAHDIEETKTGITLELQQEVEKKATRATRDKKRIPIATRNVLKAAQKKDFHRRFFNDVEDRLEVAEAAGYRFVKGNVSTGDKLVGDGSKKGSCVTKQVGGGRTAYLMEIPQEYYDEDQKAKQDAINETERGLEQNVDSRHADIKGQYGKVAIG